ncbi:hypothetical protein P5673_027507 [Acropora cervicornis]|uniref:Uncharacterized protein n=1 Tax=Acropora cervicornis TaxID=6130 RepID=A0AAD9UVJ3_ACRCE|nr:hypothetical protein P5673_027507 [Acropora cervicornis]
MAAEGGSSEGSSSDSSDDDSMDDLELLLLQNIFCGREFDVHLNFEDISEDDFPSLFRFQKHDFVRLVNGLKLPDFYFCQQRYMSWNRGITDFTTEALLSKQVVRLDTHVWQARA